MPDSSNETGLILVVDDNPSNLDLLNRLLARRGYSVQMVTNGPEALEVAHNQSPDLILLDINMPQMNGFEVSQRLKLNPATADIPVIFVSAMDDTESKLQAFSSGGVDYVSKPFQAREVMARVRTHLALRRLQRQLELDRNTLDATINAVSDLLILTDDSGKIIDCNQSVCARLGLCEAEIRGMQDTAFLRETLGVDPDELPDQTPGEVLRMELYVPRLESWFEAARSPVFLGDTHRGYVYMMKDISVYKEAAANERKAREFAEALQQAAASINSTLNIDEVLDHIMTQIDRVVPYISSNILRVEDGAARLIRMRGYEHYSEEERQRASEACFEIETTPNLAEMAKTGQPFIISDTLTYPGWVPAKTSLQIRSYIGAPLIAHSQVIAFIGLDHTVPNFYTEEHAGKLAIFAAQASMAIENARLFNEVNELATVDFLTGLYNRRHFFTLAERELQRAIDGKLPIALIILDLDYLKQINSAHGHIVGGQSLQAVGRLCSQHLPKHYISAVYGGDEFAILLPETRVEEAARVAEEFRQIVSRDPIDTYRGPVNITITLGVTGAIGNPDLKLEKLIDMADQALFHAKEAGRNRVHVWEA